MANDDEVADALREIIYDRIRKYVWIDDDLFAGLFKRGTERIYSDDPKTATLIDAYNILKHGDPMLW